MNVQKAQKKHKKAQEKHKKAPKRKISNSHPLRGFYTQKTVALVVFRSLNLFLLFFVGLFLFLYVQNFFAKKTTKQT